MLSGLKVTISFSDDELSLIASVLNKVRTESFSLGFSDEKAARHIESKIESYLADTVRRTGAARLRF